jgi:hypothetical protein
MLMLYQVVIIRKINLLERKNEQSETLSSDRALGELLTVL